MDVKMEAVICQSPFSPEQEASWAGAFLRASGLAIAPAAWLPPRL